MRETIDKNARHQPQSKGDGGKILRPTRLGFAGLKSNLSLSRNAERHLDLLSGCARDTRLNQIKTFYRRFIEGFLKLRLIREKADFKILEATLYLEKPKYLEKPNLMTVVCLGLQQASTRIFV